MYMKSILHRIKGSGICSKLAEIQPFKVGITKNLILRKNGIWEIVIPKSNFLNYHNFKGPYILQSFEDMQKAASSLIMPEISYRIQILSCHRMDLSKSQHKKKNWVEREEKKRVIFVCGSWTRFIQRHIWSTALGKLVIFLKKSINTLKLSILKFFH